MNVLIWYEISASCPMCGHRIKLRELGGGFALGQDSDLLVRMSGLHSVQAAINTCLRCRYSGYSDDFGATFRRPVAERYLAEVRPKLGESERGALSEAPLPDVQYYWAYRCAAFLGRGDGELGQRLLRAYWCLRLHPSSELPEGEVAERRKLYLAGAIHHLRQDPMGKGEMVRLYVLAELSRRNADFASAGGYFKRFLDLTADGRNPAPRYLRLAALKLLQAAEQRDARDRTMEEIVYADSPE